MSSQEVSIRSAVLSASSCRRRSTRSSYETFQEKNLKVFTDPLGNNTFLSFYLKNKFPERKSELDAEAYRRALHVINEIEYTEKFVTHLEKKQYVEAGQCMLLSHSSLRYRTIALMMVLNG